MAQDRLATCEVQGARLQGDDRDAQPDTNMRLEDSPERRCRTLREEFKHRSGVAVQEPSERLSVRFNGVHHPLWMTIMAESVPRVEAAIGSCSGRREAGPIVVILGSVSFATA
jgi:hypothetical protein